MRRVPCLFLTLLVLGACKPRDPDAAGLLDDPTPDTKVQIAKGGDWDIFCSPLEGAGAGLPTYLLEVEGAVNAGDEAQELLVTVKKSWSGRQDVLANKELGHGAVSAQGPLFVGFTSGVLTADPTPADGKTLHTGVLTLAGDQAEGLKVSCTATKVTRE
jgi:hypothetical protein